MSEQLEIRSDCAPSANGRKPEPGEQEWTITFTADDGRPVRLIVGKRGHDALRDMVLREEVDDAVDAATQGGD